MNDITIMTPMIKTKNMALISADVRKPFHKSIRNNTHITPMKK